MLQRFNTGYSDGMYTLPSGHVEDGESIVDAVLRETEEEVGVRLNENQIRHVHTMYRYRKDDPYIDFYFEAVDWSGEPCNVEEHKCNHADWFNVHDLPDNILQYIPTVLIYLGQDRAFSEFRLET